MRAIIKEMEKRLTMSGGNKRVCFVSSYIMSDDEIYNKMSDLVQYWSDNTVDNNTAYSWLSDSLTMIDEFLAYNSEGSDDELQESIYEQADSMTPIYNNEVMKWLGDNRNCVEMYSEEIGLSDRGLDLIQLGMGAYCHNLSQYALEVYELIKNIKEDRDE